MNALLLIAALLLMATLQCLAQPSSNSWSSLHTGLLSVGTNLPAGADALMVLSPGTTTIALNQGFTECIQ